MHREKSQAFYSVRHLDSLRAIVRGSRLRVRSLNLARARVEIAFNRRSLVRSRVSHLPVRPFAHLFELLVARHASRAPVFIAPRLDVPRAPALGQGGRIRVRWRARRRGFRDRCARG